MYFIYFSLNFMRGHTLRYILIIALLGILFCGVGACRSVPKEEKKYERQEAKMLKMEQKEYDKQVKMLRKSQSKPTLKMMRETERQSTKWNKSRRR
jgi:hypothetical protein